MLNYDLIFYYDSLYFVVTEFAKGGSLMEYFSNSDNDMWIEEEAKGHVKQLQDLFKYCHSKSIYHGKLSIKNVFFKDKERKILAVTDFLLYDEAFDNYMYFSKVYLS